ncbi:MAG: multidrug ABC transporter permease, partial [Thermus caldifontis]
MRKAKTLLSVYLAYMLEYRAELFLWALAGALPLILLGVWTEAARGGDFPLSPGEFARYFLMVFLVRQATVVWVVWEFERDVVEGRLSFRLLRPLDPFLEHLAAHVAERLARLPFVVLLVLLFFWIFPEARFVPE